MCALELCLLHTICSFDEDARALCPPDKIISFYSERVRDFGGKGLAPVAISCLVLKLCMVVSLVTSKI